MLIFISIRLSIKRVDGYLFYLMGNTVFILSLIYFLFGLRGFINGNEMFYFSLGIGTGLNIFFMAMAIGQKIYKINTEKENALVVMNEYSKLSSLGQAMVNVSHQWKEPINHIYYIINNIYAAKEFKDPNLSKIIDSSLAEIKQITHYMANTGKNFLNYYQDDTKQELILFEEIVEFSKSIFTSELNKENITTNIQNRSLTLLYVNKYLLSNIMVILFENSIKAFKKRDIEDAAIDILIYEDANNIYCRFHDNAGGIKVEPIESIFQKDLSDSNSTGIGLYLAKNVLQLKLYGDISVENRSNGTLFRITLNKAKNTNQV